MDGYGSQQIERLRHLEAIHGRSLYARGFYLSRERPRYLPSGWSAQPVGDHTLHYDPRVPLSRVTDSRGELILLGDAIDLRAPRRGRKHVAATLLREGSLSDEALHRETDWLCGRFLVLHCSWSGDVKALADTAGTRAVFHPIEGGCIGSHASLVAVNQGKATRHRVRGMFGFPGRMTAYDDVVILTPNHTIMVDTGKLARFYPREPLAEISVSDAAEIAKTYLVSALEGLLHRPQQVVASLTAGLDSRTTLAVTGSAVDQIQFFTYCGSFKEHGVDRVVAERLANDLGLSHQVLHLGEDADWVPESFTELCKQHSYYLNNRRGAYAYTQHFDPDRHVHLRSNLSEIGRLFYQTTRSIDQPLLKGEDLAAAYMAFKPRRQRRYFSADERLSIEQDFEEFHNATDFSSVVGLRDTRDMLYWEHRMGAWHSLVLLHSDPAFATASLFNARVIFDTLLSVPVEDRTAGGTNTRIMRIAWPQVLDYPINPWPRQLADLGLTGQPPEAATGK